MANVRLLCAGLGVVGALASGCGGSGTTTNASSTPTAATSASAPAKGGEQKPAAADIAIADMSFGSPVTVAPGATVNVTNKDGVEHSVTSKQDGVFSVDIEGKESGTFTAPSAPGEYPFYCTYHPSMTGTLIVK